MHGRASIDLCEHLAGEVYLSDLKGYDMIPLGWFASNQKMKERLGQVPSLGSSPEEKAKSIGCRCIKDRPLAQRDRLDDILLSHYSWDLELCHSTARSLKLGYNHVENLPLQMIKVSSPLHHPIQSYCPLTLYSKDFSSFSSSIIVSIVHSSWTWPS